MKEAVRTGVNDDVKEGCDRLLGAGVIGCKRSV